MSQSYQLLQDGFEQALAEDGTFLIFNGMEKQCLTSGIERKLTTQPAGFQMDVARPSCTMRAADYAALGIKLNAPLEIVTTPCGVTPRETIKLTFRSLRAAPQIPTVRLFLKFQS